MAPIGRLLGAYQDRLVAVLPRYLRYITARLPEGLEYIGHRDIILAYSHPTVEICLFLPL